MSVATNAPVIIKKKKVISGGGHHGGAWKVAYADFVTAMMAFFMLMWLLNATTEKQRKGIADYFSPTIPVNRISGGGDGMMGGDSIFTEETLAHNGVGASNRHKAERTASGAKDQGADDPETRMREIERMLSGYGGESMAMENALRHIVTRQTDEGLVVELFALPDSPLFDEGTDRPTDLLKTLVSRVAEAFTIVTNGIAVEGHSRSRPVVLIDNPTWDLSLARADQVHKMLHNTFEQERVQRVTGHGDKDRVDRNPFSVRNDRIELVLIRSDV